MTRTAFSLTPLFRSTIGFDRFNDLFNSALQGDENSPSYPPYNIEKNGENNYSIVMAVAGFSDADITISAENDELSIKGQIQEKADEATQYLHKGIANRSFERTFRLADHMIINEAELKNGLLRINLVREIPEEKKPRLIPINNGDSKKLLKNSK